MTDLFTRPARFATSAEEPAGRPLSAAAALGGLAAAGVGLVLCMALALTGWFLADGGGHGDTTDALRVGANGWLLGHGTRITVAGLPLGIVPLTITMMLVLVAFRCGRWAARNAVEVTDDRTLAGGAGIFAAAYVVVGVVVAVVCSTGSLPRTVLGALLVAGIAGGLGLAAGTGRLDAWLDLAPAWTRELATGAIAGALMLVAASAVLVCVALLLSFDEAATVLSELGLSTGDAVAYTAVAALLAPNAVLFGSAYLLGPGFAVGTGTSVSPTAAVSLGVVPAFPVLAALPEQGPTPGWMAGLLAVPALAAAVGVGLSRRTAEQIPPYDVAAMRGAGSGFGAGVLITLAIALAGGPMGTGRLADIGAPTAEVLVFATGLMSGGGLLGGVLATWWQRRRG
ncbi:MAG: hypothetical protein J7518_21185 [Nocardioidaceae bacterium]|nr:hypothetical protein [Nocardioidaceae bacterium]